MTAAEVLTELRSLAAEFRSDPVAPEQVRLVVRCAADVAVSGVDPIVELQLRLLRRRAAVHAAARRTGQVERV